MRLTRMTLNNDHNNPRTQLTVTMAITEVKLKGASHPAGVSFRAWITVSINNLKVNLYILSMIGFCQL